MISVVIPLYNKEKLIRSTLECVLSQTYNDYEIIIVNDGSTDASVKEVMRVCDDRIRLVSQTNAGVSSARNRGIAEAQGEFIAFLDADDEWCTDYLESQHKLTLLYPECDVFATNYVFRNEFGLTTPTKLRKLPFSGTSGILSNYFNVATCSHPPLWTSAVMVRKSAIMATNGFPENITSGEDLLTWARLACRYKIAFSKRVLANYYTPTTGPTGKIPSDLTSINDAMGKSLTELWKEFPNSGIKQYIAFWYKMRARINIGYRNRWATIKCSLKSLKYNKFQIKPLVFIALALTPELILKKII